MGCCPSNRDKKEEDDDDPVPVAATAVTGGRATAYFPWRGRVLRVRKILLEFVFKTAVIMNEQVGKQL